jgi:predicted RNA-binding Zn-ribbon protein involved in translation (DUF1610 family)
MSKTAQQCRKCGKWFKHPFGGFQVPPDNYDTSICPECNQEIDREDHLRKANPPQPVYT